MPEDSPADRAARLASWAPLHDEDLARLLADVWRLANENNTLLNRMEIQMADVSGLLNEVADGLRGPLATSVTELIAENQRLSQANASLTGEDVSESTAAQGVKDAFDQLAAKFTQNPDAPDVDPLPPVDGGGEPTPEPTPTPDPVNPGDGTDVVNPTVDENGNPVV